MALWVLPSPFSAGAAELPAVIKLPSKGWRGGSLSVWRGGTFSDWTRRSLSYWRGGSLPDWRKDFLPGQEEEGGAGGGGDGEGAGLLQEGAGLQDGCGGQKQHLGL